MPAKRPTASALALLFFAAGHQAAADTPAATVTTRGAANGTVWSTQGWEFTPQVNLLVTRLGVHDLDDAAPGLDGDGLVQSHEVAIWTSGGTPVVSAIVPAGTTAPLSDGTRFVDVAPTPLAAGQVYVIGTWYPDSSDTLLVDGINANQFAYDDKVAPGAGRYGINQFTGIAFPPSSSGLPRLGPNFAFALPAPVTRTWPTGSAPCNDANNLSACLDGANHGDTIEIATNAIPPQTVAPARAKSFTLQPAPGFTPVMDGFGYIFVPGGSIDVYVTIDRLGLVGGAKLFAAGGTGFMGLNVTNSTFATAGNLGASVEIYNRTGGETAFTIANNSFDLDTAPDDEISAISVYGLGTGENVGAILYNVISQNGGGQDGAIQVQNGNGLLTLDVIGNRVSGSNFNAGVQAGQDGPGYLIARIVNNVVSGQVDTAGGPAAIALRVDGGTAEYQVINNTVAYNETGIQLIGRPDFGATATAVISNNIVAFNSDVGMNLQDFAVVNDFNTVFGNGSEEWTPGPGTLAVDPQFVSTTDLRPLGVLQGDSGSSSRMPADIPDDVLGNARIQGIVDRGAYEVSAGGSDLDGDGIEDGFDNCTLAANPDQRDTDGDLFGNICDGDLNGNGAVNAADLALFRVAFGFEVPDADFNGSGGIVNAADLAIFRTLFGNPPGPSGTHP